MKAFAFLLGAVVLLSGCQDRSSDDLAHEGHEPGMEHQPGMDHSQHANHSDGSGYVPLLDSAIRGLTDAEIEVLRSGSGGGLALAAELNGYPGPIHVLELADQLAINGTQSERIQSIYDAMNAKARAIGQRILDLHAELTGAFQNRTINETSLASMTQNLSLAYGELRATHLQAHLVTTDVLTDHQVAMYGELRGYGKADHTAHAHG